MKKIIFSLTICLISILSFIQFPNLNNNFSVAETTEAPIKYTLIGKNYNKVDDTLETYNIASNLISTFTPFDLVEEKRMSGMSFKLATTENKKIENQVVYVDGLTQDLLEDNYSFFAWIHFDNTYVHNLKLTIEFENSASLIWSISKVDLYNLVKKSSDIAFNEFPFSWNKIEFPFNLAEQNGEIYTGGKLNAVSKITIDYSSNTVIEGEDIGQIIKPDFAELRFYDLHISKSKNLASYGVEKQGYRFCKLNFFDEEIVNSVCVGDTLKLPYLSQAVSFAWNGFDDLKDGNIYTVKWRVLLKTPSSSKEFLYPSFGDEITFDEEGVYQLYFQCFDTKYSSDMPIISDSIEINVDKLIAIYFDKSSYKMEVGKTYRINVYSSDIFSSVSDFSFEANSDNVSLNYIGNGILEVTPNKKGNYSINVSVNGVRPISPEETSYSTTLKIKASKVKKKDNRVFKIILWSVLGAFGVALIVLGVKTFVKSRKIDVK